VPHVYVPPQPFAAVPQLFPAHAVAIATGVQPQTPVAVLHIWGAVHVPHVYVPPQPLSAVPQLLPAHAVAIATGVQVQTFAALQVCGVVQVPHVCSPPQPFATWPHFPAHAAATSVGTQVHAEVGEPIHASLFAQAVHRVVSPHPLLLSMGTHLFAQFLVPAPQVPTTHASPWQTRVPVPLVGQPVALHVKAPQP